MGFKYLWKYLKNIQIRENLKKGTFEVLNRTDYTGPDCNFTKTEITANLQKINDLVAIVRKNEVLSEMKGFDGRARIYTSLACQQEGVYGIPVRVSFESTTPNGLITGFRLR